MTLLQSATLEATTREVVCASLGDLHGFLYSVILEENARDAAQSQSQGEGECEGEGKLC